VERGTAIIEEQKKINRPEHRRHLTTPSTFFISFFILIFYFVTFTLLLF